MLRDSRLAQVFEGLHDVPQGGLADADTETLLVTDFVEVIAVWDATNRL